LLWQGNLELPDAILQVSWSWLWRCLSDAYAGRRRGPRWATSR